MILNNVLQRLEKINDFNLRIEHDTHTYYSNDQKFSSVSNFIKNFIVPFDTETIAERTAIKRGVKKEDLILDWERERDYSNWLGHQVHTWIENYYNKIIQELPTDLDVIDRINKFNIFYAKYLHKLTPIGIEKIVCLPEFKIAGTIDSLFWYDGKVYIIDWKTNKRIKTDKDRSFQNLLYPFEEYPENELNKYSLQQSMYALMLREVGIKVEAKLIFYIGKTETKIYKCKPFEEKLLYYLKENKNKLLCQ